MVGLRSINTPNGAPRGGVGWVYEGDGPAQPDDHVVDITERVRAEPEAVPGADRQQRLAAIGQKATGVAHDFDSIISTIGVYAELIARQPGLDAAGRQHLETISQQAARATVLVSQILDYAHGRPIERADVDLVALLADFVPVLRRVLPTGIRVTWRHDADRYLIRGDAARLQQIFLNLATNARDAMSGHGELSFTLSSQRGSKNGSVPSKRSSEPWVRIDVADTGSGIPPHVLARAFEPFFTTKPAGSGTGLGLAQVQSLVSQHAGHLEVESAAGRGTTVTIWLAHATIGATGVSPPQLGQLQSSGYS